jgi:predicted deacylase
VAAAAAARGGGGRRRRRRSIAIAIIMSRYPMELVAPDISAYEESNTGVPYVHTLDSGKPGPDAMINAVTHGNEICGAVALDWLLRSGYQPTCGRLTVAFVNTAAYLAFDPQAPAETRFVDEDMNRLWTYEQLDGRPDADVDTSAELARARELRPFYERVEMLLDIHSMGSNHGPIMLCHGDQRQRQLCEAIGVPAYVGCGGGFVGSGKSRLIEFTPFESKDCCAVLVECGQHWAASSGDMAKQTTLNFLRALDMVSPAFFAANAPTPESHPPQTFLDITHGHAAKSDRFRMVTGFAGLDRIARKGTILATEGDEQPPLETPYDDTYLIMPPQPETAVSLGGRTVRFARRVSPPSEVHPRL